MLRRLKIYSPIVFVFFIFACGGNEDKKVSDTSIVETDTSNFTSIQWIDSLVELGNIKPGTKAEIKFRFKNSGSKPLFITSAKPGCGCTVADYPKEAIVPGKEGVLTAVFDTKGRAEEEFHKNVLVTANTSPSTLHYIYFRGRINSSENVLQEKDTAITKPAKGEKNINPKDLILEPNKQK